MKGGRRLLSIVVPVYNEEGNIEPLYKAVNQALAPISDRYDHEFVFTDNHSEDATFSELVRLAKRDPRVRVFRFSRNFGFQRSVYTGYMKSYGDAAVQLDCDLQDPPSLITDFVKAWEAGNKIVYGVRRGRKEGFLITSARKIFYRLIDRLSEDHLPHDAGEFRLVDRRVIEVLRRIKDHKLYLRGTLATLGFDQKGIPYDREGRKHGESKFPFRALVGLAVDGILSQSTVPLRMATYTGFVVAVVTFTALAGYAIGRFLVGKDWPAGFATTTILLLLSLSLNALFLGIIGEYVGRIYQQIRRSPLTIIEKRIDRASPRKEGSTPLSHADDSPEGIVEDDPKISERALLSRSEDDMIEVVPSAKEL
jgi:polyisoprenyl-phosphate glycosyltransferase